MLKAENGATMETDLEETPRGWVARYLIVSKDLGQLKPQRQIFESKADAVAWLAAEATAQGFVYATGNLSVAVQPPSASTTTEGWWLTPSRLAADK